MLWLYLADEFKSHITEPYTVCLYVISFLWFYNMGPWLLQIVFLWCLSSLLNAPFMQLEFLLKPKTPLFVSWLIPDFFFIFFTQIPNPESCFHLIVSVLCDVDTNSQNKWTDIMFSYNSFWCSIFLKRWAIPLRGEYSVSWNMLTACSTF